MVLISINSSEVNNGYDFTNDFAEALVLEPNSTISLISCLFERDQKFIVNALSDRFIIKQGTSTQPDETVIIAQGSYTGAGLAIQIQAKLNLIGNVKGYNYLCVYSKHSSKFTIHSSFHMGKLVETTITDWKKDNPQNDQLMTSGAEIAEGGVSNADGLLNFGGKTLNTRSYIRSNKTIETTVIPSRANGGSYIRFTLPQTLIKPGTGDNPLSVLAGMWSNQIAPVKPIQTTNSDMSDPANLTFLDIGMIIIQDNTGRQGIRFIENGVDIGCVDTTDGGTRRFIPKAGDSFNISFFKGLKHPVYQYKEASKDEWIDFVVGGGGNNGVQQFDCEANRGKKYFALFGGDTPGNNISLCGMTEDGEGESLLNYVEVEPNNPLTGFGQLTGFRHNLYILKGAEDSASSEMISDHNPIPDVSSNYHPIVHLNINNLPLRSIVGSKFNSNAVVGSKPVGSQNGISRLLAQMPRFHQSNGDSTVDKFGPFYYDYFPYSVKLKNAQHLMLNELHISLTNIDGTLAKDIELCNILVNISNESNIGGAGRESIGSPRHAHQTIEQRDVLKSQMI